jgi:LacI family transcriptional regulator
VVTLYDVARRAEVSIATVSRVLHGPGAVRATTRARVQAAIEELGYVPDGAAQSLARNRKDVIGLVCVEHTGLAPNQYDYAIESMSLLYYDEVMRGVEARIRDRDWSLLITYLREDEVRAQEPREDELALSRLLRHAGTAGTAGTAEEWSEGPREDEPVLPRLLRLSGKVDGLLIGEGVVPATALASLARRLPVVIVAGDTALRTADVVAADNWSGAYALVTHLIVEHGRRRLFHIDGPPTAPDAKMRRLAMETLIGSCSGRFSVRSGEVAAERMLADLGVSGSGVSGSGVGVSGSGVGGSGGSGGSGTVGTVGTVGSLPDAIVCANDQMAIGVLRTLSAHSIRVPDDIAVVGFDDIYHATLSDPPLTTVRQPTRGIGERACERLIERIADPGLRPEVELLPTELIIRSSCGCPPGLVSRRPVASVAQPARHVPARHPAARQLTGKDQTINDLIKER